ncbi:MAG: Sua5/YciO/YrdC/YwlC family protein, partial [Rhodoferax sp.]|nr:Sua5/YciO/YrdC/YwlC family protein [Rhodoferax sp.]
APSANRFGRISPTLAAHVASELGPDLLVLDAGPCALGIESTIIDCTRGEPVLLRPGSITRLQLEQACGRKVLSNQSLQALQPPGTPCNTDAPRAPGTLESHYAPTAKLVLMDAQTLQAAIDRQEGSRAEGFGTANDGQVTESKPQLAVYARTPLKTAPQDILLQAMPPTAEAAAHALFAALRSFDDAKVTQIWVETPPDLPEWEGVLDRLRRAAAQ